MHTFMFQFSVKVKIWRKTLKTWYSRNLLKRAGLCQFQIRKLVTEILPKYSSSRDFLKMYGTLIVSKSINITGEAHRGRRLSVERGSILDAWELLWTIWRWNKFYFNKFGLLSQYHSIYAPCAHISQTNSRDQSLKVPFDNTLKDGLIFYITF
jgi:hypothetical protein